MLWVWATLIAATAQTVRNVAQSALTAQIGTLGATQVRFVFGLPFAVLFLVLVIWFTGERPPAIPLRSAAFIALGAIAQIAATALMLRAMSGSGLAVTTAWIKTEPVMVALFAAAVLGETLTLAMFGAIALATSGVLLMTLKSGIGSQMWRRGGPAGLGLAAGALFGAAAIGFRGGIVAFPDGSFLIRATTALVMGLALQCMLLGMWMALFDRAAIRGSLLVWRTSIWAGFLGAVASQFWFIGFSLTSAANVRTVALIEVVIAQIIARVMLGQRSTSQQLAGMGVLMAGVGLLLHLQR